jgi:hypothetical protein
MRVGPGEERGKGVVHRLTVGEEPLECGWRGEPPRRSWGRSGGAGDPAVDGIEFGGGVEAVKAFQIERNRGGIGRVEDRDADLAADARHLVKPLSDDDRFC